MNNQLLSVLFLFYFGLFSNVNLAEQLESEFEGDHHVVDVEIPDDMLIPINWPLINGLLTCKTCHSTPKVMTKQFGSQQDFTQQTYDKFLRKNDVNSNQPRQDFCFNCHEKKAFQPKSLHDMLDSAGQIIERNCLYCHVEVPDVEQYRTTKNKQEKPKLRLSRDIICNGCHLKTPHLNAIEHQVKVSESMLTTIKQTERQKQITIPLADDAQVICISCHQPHQKGVLEPLLAENKAQNAQGQQEKTKGREEHWNKLILRDKQDRFNRLKHTQTLKYQQLKHEELLRLPVKDGQLCLACHTFLH